MQKLSRIHSCGQRCSQTEGESICAYVYALLNKYANGVSIDTGWQLVIALYKSGGCIQVLFKPCWEMSLSDSNFKDIGNWHNNILIQCSNVGYGLGSESVNICSFLFV